MADYAGGRTKKRWISTIPKRPYYIDYILLRQPFCLRQIGPLLLTRIDPLSPPPSQSTAQLNPWYSVHFAFSTYIYTYIYNKYYEALLTWVEAFAFVEHIHPGDCFSLGKWRFDRTATEKVTVFTVWGFQVSRPTINTASGFDMKLTRYCLSDLMGQCVTLYYDVR